MRPGSQFDGLDLGKSGFRTGFSVGLKSHVQLATTQAITTHMHRKLEYSELKDE